MTKQFWQVVRCILICFLPAFTFSLLRKSYCILFILVDPRTDFNLSNIEYHRVSAIPVHWPSQATRDTGKMPKRGETGEDDAEEDDTKRPKTLCPESPGSDSRQLHVLKWSNLSYDIVWDIFGHLSTMQKSKYRRVSSKWTDIQLKHISTSPVLKLDYFDLKYWKTIFYPPVRETRRAICKRQIKLVTDKTRWVIMDFEDRKHGWCAGESIFNLKHDPRPPLQSLALYHPQICHILLSRMKFSASYYPMPDYQFLKNLGCSPKLNLAVMVYQFELAQFPPLRVFEEPLLVDELELLRAPWPKSIKLGGHGNDYWRPLRDLYMAYWPYPPDQLQWLEECITKVPPSDNLQWFLSRVIFYGHDEIDFDEKTAVLFRGHYRQRSFLVICAAYLNMHRSRWDLPPPPHALTSLTRSSAFPKERSG